MASKRIKILITDDDMDLRELLTEAVGNWGYETSEARDGEEALSKLSMEKYDLVITDLMMPGMDGLGLLKKIKELDKDILVIVITGYATIETAVKAIEAGAYDYIAKPFRLDELTIVIKNACERLRLTTHNKTLIEELRSAYSEITQLRNALAERSAPGEDGPGIYVLGPKEQLQGERQQGYLKEAVRPVKPVKKSLKA